jgi:L-aminopeptidase/D-esterase-like protein
MSGAARNGNAVTDVPGVLVGQHERLGDGWATGSTVVLVPDGAVAAVDVRGGGPGTRETDLLDPTHLVQRVQAVLLTGGSAFGLAAADGVMRWLADRHRGFRVGVTPGEVVPIVPAAVLFDLRPDAWQCRPDASFGAAACEAAGVRVAQGCVGAGTGATTRSLRGGTGTASVRTGSGATVGALVAVNAAGTVIDPRTGLPWALDHEVAGEFGLSPPDPAEVAAGLADVPVATGQIRLNTTIGVIATDAALDKARCRRLAICGHDGLARAIRPAHTMVDGDTLFALATGAGAGPVTDPRELDELCVAAADCVARAVVHGVLAATAVPGSTVPAYRDRYPSALRRPV